LIEGKQFGRPFLRHDDRVGQRQPGKPTASFGSDVGACVVHQDPHQLRRHAEEMTSALPVNVPLFERRK